MKDYARGSYNKCNETEQWIRISEGCPNNCEFCRETKECGKEPIYFEIPEIIRNKVKILRPEPEKSMEEKKNRIDKGVLTMRQQP